MSVEFDVAQIIAVMGIPTAITGFFFWLFQRSIQRRDKVRDAAEDMRRRAAEREAAERQKKLEEHEAAREKLEFSMVQGTWAAIALSEATAKAVQRIPDAKCNGDMHAALEYAHKVKSAQKDFLAEQGIHALFE